jgi:drug/metabolite transporter (DMT)-like permease
VSRSLGAPTASKRVPGVLVAGVTALVSGVAVFVNGYGVRTGMAPSAYTTAKNGVAVVVLAAFAVFGLVQRRRRGAGAAANFVSVASEDRGAPSTTARRSWRAGLALAYVGLVGGGLAFVLFFNGLAQSQSAPAAFWRDSLVVWVALAAGVVLRERIRWWNLAAIALVVTGEIVVTGGVGRLGAERGEWDVLASSVLWAVEVVVARRLLGGRSPATLSLVRMGGGAIALVAYLALTGGLAPLWSMDATEGRWVLWSGTLLGVYVATWMSALARARAVDVTSVLAGGALLTWVLQIVASTATPAATALGFALIGSGAGLVIVAASRAGARRPDPLGS